MSLVYRESRKKKQILDDRALDQLYLRWMPGGNGGERNAVGRFQQRTGSRERQRRAVQNRFSTADSLASVSG